MHRTHDPLPPKRRLAMLSRFLTHVLGSGGVRREATAPAPTAANLPTLKGRTEIVRDRQGVARIYAEHEADAFTVLGFLQAADRFVLLDLVRHLGAGRFTELFGNFKAPAEMEIVGGKQVADVDLFLRPLEFESQCEADYRRLANRPRHLLDRFADGVNAALRAMGGVYPDEYLLFGKVKPWRPWDCLLNGRTCAFVVTLTCIDHELTFDAVRGHAGDDLARILYPDAPWENCPKSYVPQDGPTPEIGLHDIGGGSNNWAVAASRSASGSPIVANDPHVPLIPLPTFWYHTHLDVGAYKVQGGTFPGCPTFGLGHNGHLAWGVTTGFRDGWDLFRVHRLPNDSTRYRTVEGSGAITRHRAIHGARFGRTLQHEWERCEHGVIYPGWKHHDGVDLAVRFVPADMATYFEGSLDLMASTTVDAHRAALAKLNEGPFDFNHVYGHKDGHIGWEIYGRLPKRPKDGLFVRDAHDPDAQWLGFVPFDDMPKMLNPSRGHVASANSVTDPNNYAIVATHSHYEPPLRQNRISAVLGSRDDHDVASFTALQCDVVPDYLPPLRDALLGLISAGDAGEGGAGAALAALRDFDGPFATESAGAAVFYLTMIELNQACYRALLGPQLGARFAASRKSRPRLQAMLVDPSDPLRPAIERAAEKSLADLAVAALRRATERIEAACGKQPAGWQWGTIHRAWLGTALAVLPRIGRRFVALDQPLGGDNYTVMPSVPVPLGARLVSLVGPTTRFVCDLARPEEAWFAHSSGPSGDPRSPFFANVSQPWSEGAYFRSCLWRPEEVPDVVERVVIEA